ncbi:hypothetical protein [Allocoleopsis franciscana]|uniref:hypothetical protein n=1 Tax=Allocoleopsis franciscana TaxID=2886352 RepID=UPI0002D6FD0A|nr:hypothetical protein [Allocoleopsis franciscana]
MSVIVDTSVWSLALRRRTPPDSSPAVTLLRDLITARGIPPEYLMALVRNQRSLSIILYSTK